MVIKLVIILILIWMDFYVVRKPRRAVRYAYTFLDLKQAFMYELVDVLCNQMGQSFPELNAQKELIERVIKEEENSFLRTLSEGLKRLDVIMKNTKKVVSCIFNKRRWSPILEKGFFFNRLSKNFWRNFSHRRKYV